MGSDMITDFIRLCERDICWVSLCENPSSPLQSIINWVDEEYGEMDDRTMPIPCSREDLPREFLERHIGNISWAGNMMKNKNVDAKFIEDNRGRLEEGGYLARYERDQIILLNHIKFSPSLRDICLSNPNLFSGSIGEKDIGEIIESVDMDEYEKHASMKAISSNEGAPLSFFKMYPNLIHWEELCTNIGRMFENREEMEEFLEKNIDSLSWEGISGNIRISEEFIRKHIDNIEWDYIGCNYELSSSFYSEFISQIYEKSWRWEELAKNCSYECAMKVVKPEDYKQRLLLHNIPVKIIIDEQDRPGFCWTSLCYNRGFWIRLVEYELVPLFNVFINSGERSTGEK